MNLQDVQDRSADLNKRVGENVRHARKALGKSRRAFADETGVSERYIGQLETGRANISLNVLQKIAKALEADVISLISGVHPRLQQLVSSLDAEQQAQVHDLIMTHFSRPREDRSGIALIGLRGAGKTTLGKELAQRLGIEFVQLSHVVTELAGMTTQELVELAGLEAFRRLEREALENLISSGSKVVLETSGGIVAAPETYRLVLNHFFSVWLKADPEEHMQRVVEQNDFRPMAGRPQAMDDLRALLTARNAAYSGAAVTIDTSGQELGISAEELYSAVHDKF